MRVNEQYQWLIANNFIDTGLGHGNRIIYSKQLLNDREMWFTWYNGTRTWHITIYEDVDYSCTLVSDIPNDVNFNQFLPLIELIK